MFPKSIEKLTEFFQLALRLNKSRAQCLSSIVIGVVETKSVLLTALAGCLPGNAIPTSKYRRLQDFFCEVRLDYNAVATLIMGFIGELTSKPLTLALDKTSWQARGNEVDILVLCVCLGDIGIPVVWFDRRSFGGTETRHRISIVCRFASLFGVQRIHVLVGDREFIGEEWFRWLMGMNIPFVMRLRNNIHLSSKRGKTANAARFFYGLRPCAMRQLEKRQCCGVELTICGLRTSKGELLILACHGIAGGDATQAYMHRWNIETGFEKLKSHGFHMESSRLRGKGKVDSLLSVLAIALVWSYACGKWSALTLSPIRLKTHGRPEQSVFARGVMLLHELFLGLSKDLRRFAQIFFGIFRAAVKARWKK